MPKKAKPSKSATPKPTKKVTYTKVKLTNYTKKVQTALREYYDELKADGTIKGTFQQFLDKSGDAFIQKFFIDKQRSAGKFRIETILNLAHSGFKRFYIKYK